MEVRLIIVYILSYVLFKTNTEVVVVVIIFFISLEGEKGSEYGTIIQYYLI